MSSLMRKLFFSLSCLALASWAYADIPLVTTPSWTSSDSDWATGGGFGDFNGDGFIDFATGNGNDMAWDYNHVYMNHNGTLETTASWVSTEQRAFSHLMVADLNHDGKPDLAVVTLGTGPQDTNSAVIYYNTGNGLEHTASWQSHDKYHSFDCDFGDVWGDGNLSMVVSLYGVYGNNRPVRIYRNRNGVMDTLPTWISQDTLPSYATRFADLNNDGWLDLIVGHRNRLDVYYNNNGTLPTTPSWSIPNVGLVLRIAVGDVNKDGWRDVAVASSTWMGDSASIKVFFNHNGTLETNASWTASIEGHYPSCVAFGDVNNNGYPELAAGTWGTIGNGSGKSIYVFDNTAGTLSTNPDWSWPTDTLTANRTVSETVVWGDVRNSHLITTADTASGNGTRHLWDLKHNPIQSFSQALVGGSPVPLSDYCVHPMAGWVSLKNAPPSGTNNVIFQYTYSYAPDLAVTNYDLSGGSYLFLNTTPNGTEEKAGKGTLETGKEELTLSPNPFTSYTAVPGHLAESFALYDVSGRKVGVFKGDHIGLGLSVGVYFVKEEGKEGKPAKVVKIR